MSDDPENLILVYLRRIDARVHDLRTDMQELKQRLTALEIQIGNLSGTEASHYAQTMQRLDRHEARLDRIERRLEIAGASA